MSNVTIPFGDNAEETAVLLLAAVETLGLPAAVVTTGSFGNFYAPQEVADEAGVDYLAYDKADEPSVTEVTPTLGDSEPDRYLVADEADEADTFDPSTHTVEQVLTYLSDNPDQRDSVIAAEREGKNRVTITESQE